MHEVQRSPIEINSMFLAAKRIAYRYGQIGLAEPDDILQAAMLKLQRKKDMRYTNIGWLHKAVRSTAMDAGRIASRERKALCYHLHDDHGYVRETSLYDRLDVEGADVVQECNSEIDLMPGLKNMLQGLSKPLRQVLLLYSEGYSYEEIGQLTKTKIGTVRSRLHYARRRARKLWADMG